MFIQYEPFSLQGFSRVCESYLCSCCLVSCQWLESHKRVLLFTGTSAMRVQRSHVQSQLEDLSSATEAAERALRERFEKLSAAFTAATGATEGMSDEEGHRVESGQGDFTSSPAKVNALHNQTRANVRSSRTQAELSGSFSNGYPTGAAHAAEHHALGGDAPKRAMVSSRSSAGRITSASSASSTQSEIGTGAGSGRILAGGGSSISAGGESSARTAAGAGSARISADGGGSARIPSAGRGSAKKPRPPPPRDAAERPSSSSRSSARSRLADASAFVAQGGE